MVSRMMESRVALERLPRRPPTQSVTTRDAIPILIEFGLVCQVVIEVSAWLKLVGREMLLQFKAKL